MLVDSRLEQRVVARERCPHRLGRLLPEGSAAFDVGEEERHRTAGKSRPEPNGGSDTQLASRPVSCQDSGYPARVRASTPSRPPGVTVPDDRRREAGLHWGVRPAVGTGRLGGGMATVNSVLGPLNTADLGFTLTHEHLFTASAGIQQTFPELFGDFERLTDQVAPVID